MIDIDRFYYNCLAELSSLRLSEFDNYRISLTSHIAYVREAGFRIGAAPYLLAVHDDSKWTPAEFPYYAQNFHSDSSILYEKSTIKDNFSNAWLHHIHYNPHHWQYWIFSDGFSPKGGTVENGVVKMPEKYVVEMVADWMGASRQYTNSWNMTDWLVKNLPKISLHSESKKILVRILLESNYNEVLREVKWL